MAAAATHLRRPGPAGTGEELSWSGVDRQDAERSSEAPNREACRSGRKGTPRGLYSGQELSVDCRVDDGGRQFAAAMAFAWGGAVQGG